MSCDKVREETTQKTEETPCGNRTVVLCKWNLDEVLKNSSERKVLIPVDGSDHSEHAFKCKYTYQLYNLFYVVKLSVHIIIKTS